MILKVLLGMIIIVLGIVMYPLLLQVLYKMKIIKQDTYTNLIINGVVIINKLILKLRRVKIKYNNQEMLDKIDKNKPVVIIANHTSNLDPVVVFKATKYKQVATISKIEMLKFLPLKFCVNGLPMFFVDRNDPVQSIKIMRKCKNYILEKNMPLLIFPEGKRSKSDTINEFKSGVELVTKKIPETQVIIYRFNNLYKKYNTTINVDLLDIIIVKKGEKWVKKIEEKYYKN